MLSQSSGSRGVYNRSFSHLKDTLFGKDATVSGAQVSAVA